MHPIEPEFVARRHPPVALWWACALFASGALAALLMTWYSGEQAQHLRLEISAAQQAVPQPAPAASVAPPAYADSAREFLAERSPGWQATLLALERTALIGVTPISIELQPRERTARVEVEFADYAVLMRYLDQLNAGGGSAEWSLVSAQRSGAAPGTMAGTASASTAVLVRRW